MGLTIAERGCAKDTKSCGLVQRLCQSAKVQTGPGFAQAQQSRDDGGGVGDWPSRGVTSDWANF